MGAEGCRVFELCLSSPRASKFFLLWDLQVFVVKITIYSRSTMASPPFRHRKMALSHGVSH